MTQHFFPTMASRPDQARISFCTKKYWCTNKYLNNRIHFSHSKIHPMANEKEEKTEAVFIRDYHK